ncbi:translation elongation factor 4 [Leptospira borgpetersenii]|uniref:Elongation factor 4 n=3 Tax=Leptospira borgpetersenii serovar Hardjo-bovis TaxID=338217 RepID=LEPA_LEPBJ|nr:translation elongation factor 4 [Leptospira borgpetersenii]Q04SN9.1 RecName: Full=Elongation factor 4; Short=EF-4; AltName: Full=Ribosomal back-translocase LepA [Leptospira borgpetersenii serovar Hardjo-bovis str. JB197]Q050R3.1 RecName: Full=Elongation factor 4; Short=EF-4; AltName: Full=Ribosomal back-translocase LepA [Leptospira borgpetersenii serovar Hardjo-bovis str. L550]ABJ76081.1 GTPase [Leptospira borgpetersenii serovar Hardjo-bovis str. JB197]ABJ79182.1 GTPase [Leptospira borgpeter
MSDKQQFIRNFSIIAHIDHGKSTLADRLLEIGQVTNDRTKKDQILDSMDIERERGITIKANNATFDYLADDGNTYTMNLLDTPGHVDFTYEVSRSLKACEGVLLIVDASQGVEAQTLANLYLAMEQDLEILPVMNKIDLPAADVEKTKIQIEESLGLDSEKAVAISAKTGLNVKAVLEAITKEIPAPKGDPKGPLKALIYDSYFDPYMGVVIKIRVFDGSIKKGDRFLIMSTGKDFTVNEVGINRIALTPTDGLGAGEVGYLIAGIKKVSDAKTGDTITLFSNPTKESIPGYKEAKPMVFSGLYPINGEQFDELVDAIEKLKLNDAALIFEKESSVALGFGFRVGYLGLLHMEIVQERLEREFNLDLITTAPSVKYIIRKKSGEVEEIDNPSRFPEPITIESTEEPYVKATVITPNEYVGNIMALAMDKRGIQLDTVYLTQDKVQLTYELPLAELIFEFYDKLKSFTRGYASLDYEPSGYRISQLVKMDILVNGEPVDALSMIVHRTKAEQRGREIIEKLKDLIPRHQFMIPIQAAVGGKILARESISALRKNVTAKCYGGDITRKKKLLEKQKEGKKRMKQIGNVEIPQEAFLAVLKTNN